MAGGRRVQRTRSRGRVQNPIVPFSFLFINRKSRQTGHYGKTWKHPIPFRPRYVESSCAICTEIVRETWSKPGEKMKYKKIMMSKSCALVFPISRLLRVDYTYLSTTYLYILFFFFFYGIIRVFKTRSRNFPIPWMDFSEHKIECLVEYSLVSKWSTKSGWTSMVINGNIDYHRRSIYFCNLRSSTKSIPLL